jgi:DNA-directed RNA polymerase specialized sigma24 family protein
LTTDVVGESDEAALKKALSDHNDQSAWSDIVERFGGKLLGVTRRGSAALPRLPEELCEEVIAATWAKLLEHDEGFDPTRMSASQFIYGLRRNADKQVRRRHGFWYQSPILSLEAPRSQSTGNGEVSTTLGESLEDLRLPFEMRVELLDEARRALDAVVRAPGHVAAALRAIYYEDVSLNEAAKLIGMDRVTLTRHIRRWAKGALVKA